MAAQVERLAELAVRVGANVQPEQDVVVLAFDVEQAPIARAVAEVAYAGGARFVSVSYWISTSSARGWLTLRQRHSGSCRIGGRR